jgi:cell division septum initiation protein DivIVA
MILTQEQIEVLESIEADVAKRDSRPAMFADTVATCYSNYKQLLKEIAELRSEIDELKHEVSAISKFLCRNEVIELQQEIYELKRYPK